jgi:hypothetical protein
MLQKNIIVNDINKKKVDLPQVLANNTLATSAASRS